MSKTAITGALSFSGRYLAIHLLDNNLSSSILNLSSRNTAISSHNLTSNHVKKVTSTELCFYNPNNLTKSLEGVDVLYCTYWIRFSREDDNHFNAADRCKALFECARDAGVKKVVYVAHTGLSLDSPYEYIAGKARAAQHLRDISSNSKMNYAIIKPCGIFGDTAAESILFNNAAYVMRRTPLFLLPQNGMAKFQPIYVQDMVELMTTVGNQSLHTTGEELDAVGPDSPTALELFSALRDAIGASYCHVLASHLPTRMVTAMTKPLDWWTGDILLDRDDLDLMYSGLTVADDPDDERIKARKSVLEWFQEHGEELGREYVSSVERYYYSRTVND